MMRWVYSALLTVLSPVLLLWMALRARRAGGHWAVLGRARFGRYPPRGEARIARSGAQTRARLLWVHAVSLGETRAAAPLIRYLLDAGHSILLTHMTATGWAEGARVYADDIARGGLRQMWLPYDFPGATRRFIDHCKPDLGILIEREVWPNLMAAATRADLPVILASARMSAASCRQNRRLGMVMRPAYARLRRVYAQTLQDAERLQRVGARQISISGNFKFDVQVDAEKRARGETFARRLGRPIIVIASTREGEDALFIEAIRRHIERYDTQGGQPDAAPLYILVPRHPQRFDAAADALSAAGLRFIRRTELQSLGESSHAAQAACDGAAVLLGDTLGEMVWFYAASRIAIVAGSYMPLGGQNFIEASALGRPVIVGPHTAHFELAVSDALAAGAIERVQNAADAVARANAWLADPGQIKRMGEAGQYWVGQHAGAVQRVVNGIEDLLPAPPKRTNA